MKIKTGIKAGNVIDSAKHALYTAGDQLAGFINTASAQAQSLADQAGHALQRMAGKIG